MPTQNQNAAWGYGGWQSGVAIANPFYGVNNSSNFHTGANAGATSLLTVGGGTSLHRTPSNSEFDKLRQTETNEELDSFINDFGQGGLTVDDKENRPRRNSDLMHFAESDELEYMSLDFFDPLYSRTRRESVSSKDSSLSYSFFEAEESRTKPTAASVQNSVYPTIPKENDESFSATEDALEEFLRFSGGLRKEEVTRADDAPERPPPPRIAAQVEVRASLKKLNVHVDKIHVL